MVLPYTATDMKEDNKNEENRILRAVTHKLKKSSGFTLTETLSTLVIMSLVGIMITAGIATAVNTYREITEYSEAQSLLSNTLTLLEDELIYAKSNVSQSDSNKTVTFDHATKGKVVLSSRDSTTGGIAIDYKKDGTFTGHPQPLVGYQKREDIYTDWVVDFTSDKRFKIDLSVKRKENESEVTLIEIKDIYIVPLNYGT